ncbi:MAG: response regulator [Bdellovibrionales bacterium]|nr:response regulator [Bdellovibrionales bacterium]
MKKKILIVDDEERIVVILQARLESKGYTTLKAGNGHEALELIQKEKPDLILLDVRMPKMDGYTFLNSLKQIPNADDIPIIVCTAQGKVEDLFVQRDVVDFVTKPFDTQSLLEKIKNTIGEAPLV